MIVPHWAATARLKLGSPQPVRCCLTTIHFSLTRCVGFRVKTDKRIENCAPGNRKMKTSALKLGTWNVRTMTPGFSDDLQKVNDARKTAVIDRELSRLQMDIVALQETRLPETGSVRERDFILFWQSKPSDEVREHGVGFAVRNKFIGVHSPTSRRNRANPVSPTLNILRTGQSDQCLCTNFGIHSRSKRQVL